MKKIPTISATMVESGRIMTTIEGTGAEALAMLAMLNRSVATLMLEAGNEPEAIEETLKALVAAGMGMATEKTGGPNA